MINGHWYAIGGLIRQTDIPTLTLIRFIYNNPQEISLTEIKYYFPDPDETIILGNKIQFKD